MRVATIGNFDGVHRGHLALLDQAAQRAAGAELVAVTFDPHPAAVLRPERAPARLTTAQRRADLLREAGADDVVIVTFDAELAQTTPEGFARFIRSREGLNADVVVIGENFRFGKGAAGDTTMLAEFGRSLGFDVEVMPLASAAAGSPAWSSTLVRDRIAEGDLRGAAEILGRPHRLEGMVVQGDQRGRQLGYPTANVDVPSDMAVPPDGVYAGYLVVAEARYPAAISIGTNPQFGGSVRRVEAYALGRDDLDLYGLMVGVDIVERLRGQEVFASVGDLQVQMGRDVAMVGSILGD